MLFIAVAACGEPCRSMQIIHFQLNYASCSIRLKHNSIHLTANDLWLKCSETCSFWNQIYSAICRTVGSLWDACYSCLPTILSFSSLPTFNLFTFSDSSQVHVGGCWLCGLSEILSSPSFASLAEMERRLLSVLGLIGLTCSLLFLEWCCGLAWFRYSLGKLVQWHIDDTL